MNEELKKVDQNARRALRWADRLFSRVSKLERENAKLKAELKAMHKNLLDDIVYNHNHLVGVIDKRIAELKKD